MDGKRKRGFFFSAVAVVLVGLSLVVVSLVDHHRQLHAVGKIQSKITFLNYFHFIVCFSLE